MRHLGRIVEDAVASLATMPHDVTAGRKAAPTRGLASKLLSGLLLLIRP
jgi:hypothetical protein